MEYIKRHIEETLIEYKEQFPALLLTGPRQVGKSTVLKNVFENIRYETLDDVFILEQMKNDARGYLSSLGTPVILDEIQRVPESFIHFKLMIDKDRHSGMYILTGSQKYKLMKGVSESLAGRIGIVNLLGLSNREINGDAFNKPFMPTRAYLNERKPNKNITSNELWKRIHQGSMPEMHSNHMADWQRFYSSYVQAYLDRDVNELAQVGNKMVFTQFMTALASRTGELLNLASLARDVGIDQRTVKNWLSILEASNIIYLLQPFSLNISKRVVKTPKVYFTDTGLICYLCRWLTPETLENGAMAGNIYETFVVNEILKSYYNAGVEPNLYFFRNTNGQEVDLLIYENQTIYPIEIKKTASPNIKDIKHFGVLQSTYESLKIGEGGVVCSYPTYQYLDKNNSIIPILYI